MPTTSDSYLKNTTSLSQRVSETELSKKKHNLNNPEEINFEREKALLNDKNSKNNDF